MNARFSLRLSPLALLGALLAATSPILAADKKSDTSIDWSNASGAANLDPKYTPEALRETFQALCKKLRYRIHEMAIDQTEFPFLIYGVIDGRADYRAIREALPSFPGYAYTGSTTLVAGDGSATYFVLNMIPSSAHPRDQLRGVHDRTRERMRSLMPHRPSSR